MAERAIAWAYLAELRVRLGDDAGAQRAAEEVRGLALLTDLSPQDEEAVAQAVGDVAELSAQEGP